MSRPRRTWLFAPGMDERKMTKADAGPADALILDLEDAVAISEKPRARNMVRAMLDERSPERQVYVRVNDIQTGWTAQDLEAVCVKGLAGIILPKVEAAETVSSVSAMIDTFERAGGLPAGQVRINAIIETARGIAKVCEIAEARGRLDSLMFGAGDYTADLGIPTANTGPHLTYGKIATVIACRSAGLTPPIDTVYFDVANPDGFRADCEEAKALGFHGKAVIHPNQVETANTIFAPSEGEVAAARRLVDTFRDAESRGIGAVQIDGKLVDYAMLKTAEKTLALADSLR